MAFSIKDTYRYYEWKQQEYKSKPYFDLRKVWIIGLTLRRNVKLF